MADSRNDYWKATELLTESAVLDNGLRVVAHRDSKTPLVAVFVAYQAGSGRENRPRSCLAHLCEHLMFCGSSHAPDSYFLALERAGGSSINAHVRYDYSGYFEAVPRDALDLALWMESERMGWVPAALDRRKFEAQVAVVRNELIERENAPYGRAPRLIARYAHSSRHPYSHPPNGIVEDLDNLTPDDACRWFTHYHGASNAALVIAGDVEPARAIDRARHYFADVSPGPAVEPLAGLPEEDQGGTRRRVDCDAGRARIYMVWNAPRADLPLCAALELAGEILAGGPTSILSRALVEEKRVATEIGAELCRRALGSQFVLWATAAEAMRDDARAVEEALGLALRRFLTDGPDEAGLEGARVRAVARFLGGIERMCGPGSRAEALAEAVMLAGRSDLNAERFRRIRSVTRDEVLDVARQWLVTPRLTLEMRPSAEGARPWL